MKERDIEKLPRKLRRPVEEFIAREPKARNWPSSRLFGQVMRENPKLITDFRRWDRAGRPSSAEIQARRLGKLADRAWSMEIRLAEALADMGMARWNRFRS